MAAKNQRTGRAENKQKKEERSQKNKASDVELKAESFVAD